MMVGFLGSAYPWVKAAHLIFVIFWMAGLFMLPRFLVYHQETPAGSPELARWIERETKLRHIILTPSLILVWVLGLLLAANIGLFSGEPGLSWLHAKLFLVVLLTGYHMWAVGYARKLAAGRPTLESRQLRMVNEVPAIVMAVIVILVIVRPFA